MRNADLKYGEYLRNDRETDTDVAKIITTSVCSVCSLRCDLLLSRLSATPRV